MKKNVTVLMTLALSIIFTNTLIAQEERKGNFRFGMSFDVIHTIIQPVDDSDCDSDEAMGFHCEVYLPIKDFQNINLVLGGLWIDGYEDNDYLNHEGNETDITSRSEIIGSYVGLRSSIGKSIGFEGSACLGYFAHRGTIEKSEEGTEIGFSQSAGSSLGGLFSVGPFIDVGKLNCSLNIYFVGAGGETGVYTSSGGVRFLIGTSFNL